MPSKLNMPSKLFEPSSIGTLKIKNRFVRSATWEGMADEDGSCTSRLVNLTGELAKGNLGLIVSSHAFVSPEGQAGPWQLAVHDDQFIPGLTQMAKAAHDGGSAIVLQLAHAGLQAATPLTKVEALGPSSLPRPDGTQCRQMTLTEIQRTVDAFVAAAVRAKAAGFDGVQIHAAHGYLLSQFLSPYFNKRQDDFGGSIENRARIVLDILGRIKSTLGDHFPVLIKMNSEDFINGGLTVEEMLQIAQMLENAGIDGIELSGGTADAASQFSAVRRGRVPTVENEVFYRDAAKRYRETIKVPLILVGGIRSYSVAENLIDDGVADFVSLCRPLIREPRLIARWKSGDTAKSECGSCNLCFKPILEGKGMYCVSQERERRSSTVNEEEHCL
jgi:2,4-dienoyl-CoA reductase-like NADH-dependent reductase (Old Yellow Enzyme family)